MECGLAWSVLLSTTMRDTKYCGLTRPIRVSTQEILTTVMTRTRCR